ncbi:phage distal tail protein [Kutzneria sp. CA-103260]|uniref:phage distal tail protein n=1 Tax=Kutzneria sp. CA-103260 TaxID=2802641 RepID=UPI002012A959|nr:phage tail domain-containing protein [Kutzneria sp. CA-103260]
MTADFTALQLPVYAADVWAGNTVDPDGVEWWVTKEQGWNDTPDMRLGLVNKARADGAFDSPGYRSPRVITLEGLAIAPSWQAKELAKNRLAAVFTDATALGTFQVREQLFTRQVQARLSGHAKMSDRTRATFEWSLQITAPDPMRYGSVAYQQNCGLPQPAAGLTFPLAFPLDFGNPVGGSLLLTNQGTAPARPVWTIQGPCAQPTIVNQNTGQRLSFSLRLGAETLYVDTAARTVLLGDASRRSALDPGSSWFTLPPGSTSVAFEAADGTDTARLVAYWRDTWI